MKNKIALYCRTDYYASQTASWVNILFINASGLGVIRNFGSDTMDTPGINMLMQNSVCFTQSFMTNHKGASALPAMLQGSGYQIFHVGNGDISDKNKEDSFTILHEGGCCGELSDQDVTSSARSFLRHYEESTPFFLSVNYCSFGEAYSASQHNYMRLIEKVDMEIELLLFELKRSQWKDDTLMIFSSDCSEKLQTTGKVPLIFTTLDYPLNISQNTLADMHLGSVVDFNRTVLDFVGI
jgi:hypothetical protein